MPRWFNITAQAVGMLFQAFNAYGALLGPKYMLLGATIVGSLQAVIAIVAHNYNPDGTPAALPYVAPK